MYQIKLDQFEGPLDLLLKLIEDQKLDITQLSLAKITDQYIEYLNRREDLGPGELADFLVVAAKLLFIKSRVILPFLGDNIEEESYELEAQLKIYREYLEASRILHKIILRKKFSFFRQRSAVISVFIVPENVNQAVLAGTFVKILKNLEPLTKIPQETIRRVFSLKEKIKEIQAVISQNSAIKFDCLIKKTSSKVEIIISFLALLELVKQRTVVVAQESSFEEIIISRNGD